MIHWRYWNHPAHMKTWSYCSVWTSQRPSVLFLTQNHTSNSIAPIEKFMQSLTFLTSNTHKTPNKIFSLDINGKIQRSVMICPFLQWVYDSLQNMVFVKNLKLKCAQKNGRDLNCLHLIQELHQDFLVFNDYAKRHFSVLNILKSNCGWQPSREEDKNLNALKGILDISFNIYTPFYFDILGVVL